MGGLCCCEGGNEPDKEDAPPQKENKDKKHAAKASAPKSESGGDASTTVRDSAAGKERNDEDQQGMVMQSEGGPDAEAFDEAFRNQNLGGLVALMDSREKIQTDEQMHQWAKNPTTIGALAGTQLAIRASINKPAEGDPINERLPYDADMKNKIRKAGAIPKFVEFLNSGEEDRIHTAVVALSFLCIENPVNAEAAYQAGALKPLIPLMLSPMEGLACAASSICRNIIVEDERHKREFVQYGGAKGFVKLVSPPPNARTLDEEDMQRMLDLKLEAMLTICDLLEDSEDDKKIIPEYAKLVSDLGLRTQIEKFFEFDDQELIDIGQDILASLEKVV